jgi:hypothetical protein
MPSAFPQPPARGGVNLLPFRCPSPPCCAAPAVEMRPTASSRRPPPPPRASVRPSNTSRPSTLRGDTQSARMRRTLTSPGVEWHVDGAVCQRACSMHGGGVKSRGVSGGACSGPACGLLGGPGRGSRRMGCRVKGRDVRGGPQPPRRSGAAQSERVLPRRGAAAALIEQPPLEVLGGRHFTHLGAPGWRRCRGAASLPRWR